MNEAQHTDTHTDTLTHWQAHVPTNTSTAEHPVHRRQSTHQIYSSSSFSSSCRVLVIIVTFLLHLLPNFVVVVRVVATLPSTRKVSHKTSLLININWLNFENIKFMYIKWEWGELEWTIGSTRHHPVQIEKGIINFEINRLSVYKRRWVDRLSAIAKWLFFF